MRRYHIQDRDDYKRYNRLVGQVTALVHRLRQLDAKDDTRIELTDQMLDKCAGLDLHLIPGGCRSCVPAGTAALQVHAQ